MKKHLFWLLLVILTYSKPVLSIENDSLVTRIFELIYNEKYSDAHHEILKNEASLDTFYKDVLSIDLIWWEYVQSKENKKAFVAFLDSFDARYQNPSELKLRKLIKNSYLIRYNLKQYNVIGAMSALTTVKLLLEEIKSEKLNLPENRLKLLELYSELFQYFNNLFNPFFTQSHRDARTDALNRVEKFTNDKDLIVKTLSLYFLGKIYLNIEKEKSKGIACFSELSKLYKDNKLFHELINTN